MNEGGGALVCPVFDGQRPSFKVNETCFSGSAVCL